MLAAVWREIKGLAHSTSEHEQTHTVTKAGADGSSSAPQAEPGAEIEVPDPTALPGEHLASDEVSGHITDMA
jgi:hypothetical protein